MLKRIMFVCSLSLLFFGCVQKVDKIKIIESEISKYNFNGKFLKIKSFTAKTLLSSLGIHKASIYMDDVTFAVFLDLYDGTNYDDLKKDFPDILKVVAGLYKIDYDLYSIDYSSLDKYIFENDGILAFIAGGNSKKIEQIILKNF